MPSSKIELQSIPQPANNENYISLNNESVDDLWLKLSAPSIQNIWKKEIRFSFPFDNESQRNKHLVPMIQINFHRNLQSKTVCCPKRAIDISLEIPKNIETELLGSLLSIINENLGDAFLKANDTAKSYFPEAHGEWTKHLFPYRVNFNPRFEKNSGVWNPWNAAPSLKESDTNVKLECRCSEIAELPVQFFKYVPPPTFTARFRLPYMNYQSRNRVVFMPPNNLTSNPSNQHMQLKVPKGSGSGSNVQPTTCFSQTSFPKHYNIRQRLSAPTACITGQYHKLNILQPHHQYYNSESTIELQRYPSNIGKNICAKTISLENEVKYLNYTKHRCEKTETIDLGDIPLPTTEPFVQLSHVYNIPFRIQQNTGNTSKTTQSTILNPESQVHESKMPLKMTYPMANVRLRKPMIKMAPPPRNHYILPQFTTKPRFLGSITVNSLKRMQERLFQQRQQYEYINNPSYQNLEKIASFENMSSPNLNGMRLGYEDKVEKWLESTNKYFKNGSYINLEDLPKFPNGELPELTTIELPKLSNVKLAELPSNKLRERTSVESAELSGVELPELSSIKLPKHSIIKLLDVYDKSYKGGKGDSEESVKSQNENTAEAAEQILPGDHIKSTVNTCNNTVIRITRERKANILKCKKSKAKKKFFEHLQLFPDIVPRLKSCKNSRKKTKIVRKYFAEISSLSSKKFPLKYFIEILGKKNEFIKKVGQTNTEFSILKRERCLGMKLDKQFSTESDFNMDQSNLLINDISKYSIWIRESQEFNAFPSKRGKLSKSQPSFLKTKPLVRGEQDRWISSLKYFDSIIDELLFAENGIEGILFNRNQNRMIDEETNGWSHFKVDVKTVMKNLIFSLNAQIA